MPKGIHPKMAQEIIERAVGAVAGDAGVKKAAPSVNVLMEASRKIAKINGKREATFASIKVSAHDATIRDDGHPITVMERGQLVDAGPKKRTPINAKLTLCVTVKVGNLVMIICASTS